MRWPRLLRILSVAASLVCGAAALAQQPLEYPVVLHDRFIAAHDWLFPAPPGWGISMISVRNQPHQRLASLVFYGDGFRPFSEISFPQTVLFDAMPVQQAAPAHLAMLAARGDSFWILTVGQRRVVETSVELASGEHGVMPSAGSAELVGVCRPTSPFVDSLVIVLFHYFDQPLRHVIAAYTLGGAVAWQILIGGEALRAIVVEESGASHDESILFSTDAAVHESGDTVRLSPRSAHIGTVSAHGVLQWVRSFPGEGTRTCTVALPLRGEVLCAIAHPDSAELVLVDARDGRERRFTRITGAVAVRTLCATEETISIAVLPDHVVLLDSSLRSRDSRILPRRIGLDAGMSVLASEGARYALGTTNYTALLDDNFALRGFLDAGMQCAAAGPARHSGTLLAHDAMIVATVEGAMLRVLEDNHWWWWHRYRAAGGAVLAGAILVFALIAVGRRFAFYRTYYNQLVRGSVATGVVAINRQGRVIHLNNAARELLHVAPYIPLQRHITEYLAGAAYADVLQGVRDCLQNRATYEKIVALQIGGIPRTLLSRARPTLTRNGVLAGCLLQLEDITRTIERERLMSWASVAHHVAHEMKTPIGTVLLNAQHVLKSEDELPERARKYFRRIATQAERLSGILQNFLSIARVSTMRFAPTDIAVLVQSIAADYAELLPAYISLTCQIGALDGTVFNIDEQQLTSALRNVLDNAVHAITPNPGSIALSVDEYPYLQHGAAAISVRDTGKGMTDECRARIFEPFFTETPGGSGIGMVIVKRIIDEHQGFIEVESTLGDGTLIRFVLPRGEGG